MNMPSIRHHFFMSRFLLAPSFILLTTLTSLSWAGNISMLTYFPAPAGSYDRLTLIPQTINLNSSCVVGTLATDATTGNLYYCHNIAGTGTWGFVDNTWTQSGNYIYPTATSTNPLIFSGIGTSTPPFKLTLNNDGGILAMGAFGSGTVVNYNFLAVPRTVTAKRFLWYPRKAALRAMEDPNSLTNDAAIGDYSNAFGKNNRASAVGTTVSGQDNSVTGNYAAIAGGFANNASGIYAVVTGGWNNTASGQYATVSGVENGASGDYATVSGGGCNFAAGLGNTVSGGQHNNELSANSCTPHAFNVNYSTISGGSNNNARAQYSTIGGGYQNTVSGNYATIVGGRGNTGAGSYSFISGGFTNAANGAYSTIGGGSTNSATGDVSTIGGGLSNTASGQYATIPGGNANNAAAISSVIAGGSLNSITNTANYSVIANGDHNTTAAPYSWVGGRYMNLSNAAQRTFVWGNSDTTVNISAADSFILAQGTTGGLPVNPKLGINEVNPSAILSITLPSGSTRDFLAITSTGSATPGDILIVKNNGYVGIGQPNPVYPLQFGPQANNAYLTTGGAWTTPSSRKFKENISALAPAQAIATLENLNPVTYTYKIAPNEHHVGFIAEDVPDLIAAEGRRSVDPMNIAGILTAVLQDQKKILTQQNELLNSLEKDVQELKADLRR